MIGVAYTNDSTWEVTVDTDMDTFATALYVKIDDELATNSSLRIWRPEVGIAPQLSDAELLTMAVLQALLGFTSETRFLRYAHKNLRGYFPYLPHQSGYNKRLRKSQGQLNALIRVLGQDTDLWDDDTWVIDSTPVECGRSRPTVRRSDLTDFAGYGYCASHSRYFWGLRLHLVCTPAGLPVTFALANPKIDEREVARDLFEIDQDLLSNRPGARFLKPLRQLIESVNETLKGQLDLERHGGHTPQGVVTRVLQRLLALTAAIWHNHHSQQPVLRSLVAYDH